MAPETHAGTGAGEPRRKLVLDLDCGIDDALAIAYALGSPEVDLVGITCTYGNVTVEESARNALTVLDVFGRQDVPVYLGLPCALDASSFSPAPDMREVHGTDGLGQTGTAPSARRPEGKGAVEFLAEAARAYGEDLLYVPCGPLTNLAALLEQDPEAARLLGPVTFMGGALTVPGNKHAWDECNIAQDPRAADAVLRSDVKTRMVGLDVTMRAVLTAADAQLWREQGGGAGAFLASMSEHYIGYCMGFEPWLGGCALHDPLAAAAAMDPELVGWLPANLAVELDGPCPGRTVATKEGLLAPEKTSDAALTVDAERFHDRFMARTLDACRRA